MTRKTTITSDHYDDKVNNKCICRQSYVSIIYLVFEFVLKGGGGQTVKAFFKLLTTGPKKLMLIGPASTQALEPVAEAAPLWNLLQV